MQSNEGKEVMSNQEVTEGVNKAPPLLTARQRAILTGVLSDQQYLANLPTGRDFGLSGVELGPRRIQVRDAQVGLVPMNLAGWIGHVPSNSECVLCHREYLRLEGMGLLERHNQRGGHRTSHLRLTPAGRWVAESLLADESPAATDDTTEPLDIGDLNEAMIELVRETIEAGTDAQ